MKKYVFLILGALIHSLINCSSGVIDKGSQSQCGSGRTLLDGACVSQNVADLAGCMRARGSKLSISQIKDVSVQIGYMGTEIGGESNNQSQILGEYGKLSDEAELELLKVCDSLVNSTKNYSAISGLQSKPSFIKTIKSGGIDFTFNGCEHSGPDLKCNFLALNRTNENKLIWLDNRESYCLLPDGTRYVVDRVFVGGKEHYNVLKFNYLPDSPVKVSIRCKGANVGIEEFHSIKLGMTRLPDIIYKKVPVNGL